MIKIFKWILYAGFIFNVLAAIFAQTQPWVKLQSPVNVTLRRLSFVDSLTGWAAGEGGTIIRTTDGGKNWEVQNSTVQTFILDIFFINKSFGWALTIRDEFPFNSVILKTSDGGNTWQADDFPDSSKLLRTIFFFDSLKGFVGGSYLGYTSDGGNNWTAAEIDSNLVSGFPIYNFSFYSQEFGYACGGRIDVAGVIWKTTNSGLNWIAQGVSSDEVFDLYILDSLNAITLSGDPEGFFPIGKITTTNSGETWDYDALPFFGLSFAIDFRRYNEGWSASGYKFLLTTDRGESWTEFETPDSTIIYDLQFTDSRNGYAVGNDGTILKFDASVVSLETEPNIPNEFVLFQNYPNPFNPTTVISCRLPVASKVNLKVFNILGKEIKTLANDELPIGEHNFEFNATGLPSGIYFYQLRSGKFVQTKKMSLIK